MKTQLSPDLCKTLKVKQLKNSIIMKYKCILNFFTYFRNLCLHRITPTMVKLPIIDAIDTERYKRLEMIESGSGTSCDTVPLVETGYKIPDIGEVSLCFKFTKRSDDIMLTLLTSTH